MQKNQPPKPAKGATPAEIKAWIAKCQVAYTDEERAEYEATGRTLNAIFDRIGFDPAAKTFAERNAR